MSPLSTYINTPFCQHAFAGSRSGAFASRLAIVTKSRNRQGLCACPRIDAESGQIGFGDQPGKGVSQRLSPLRESLATTGGKARLVHGLQFRQRRGKSRTTAE